MVVSTRNTPLPDPSNNPPPDPNTSDPNTSNPPPPDTLTLQLATIASRLERLENLQSESPPRYTRRHGRRPMYDPYDNRYTGWDDREEEETEHFTWRRNPTFRPFTKIEFPKFEGGDPRGWILKAEKYFRYYQTADDLKVDVASMYLEGDALELYSWLTSERQLLYWEDLVQALQDHYGPAEFQNPDEYLCGVRQTGTVQEYRQEFAKRTARITNWPDHCLLGVFLNGLKDELKADVRIHKPTTVYKAMSLALEFESKLGLHTKARSTGNPNTKISVSTEGVNPVNKDKEAATGTQSTRNTSNRPWDEEKQARFAKGLCFRCNEKFGPGHRCKPGTFALLEANPDNDEDTREEEEMEADVEPKLSEFAAISLQAILGKHPATMKLMGRIGRREVIILVDSGSTHNFVSESIVRDLQLPLQLVSAFGVQIGNGDIIRCNRICKNVEVQLPGLKLIQDYYPFSIGGADLVLGIQWLASLNTVQANWNEMFLIFTLNGQKHKLQGVPAKNTDRATFQYLSTGPTLTHPPKTPFQSIHPISHVSLLRPAKGQLIPSNPPALPISPDWELILNPAQILSHRWVKEGGIPTLELLVEWNDRPIEEATWENYDILASQFPSFRLEDKSNFERGSTDTNPPLRVYSRKKYRPPRDKEEVVEYLTWSP